MGSEEKREALTQSLHHLPWDDHENSLREQKIAIGADKSPQKLCIFAAIYEFERQQDTEGFYPFLQRPRSACCMGRDAIQMVVFRFGCRGRAQRPRRLYQEPQLLEVSENKTEEGRKRVG